MAQTTGLNHLGLTVKDLDQTTAFFVDVLGWEETARDPGYPRTTVTDGSVRLTLWQADKDARAFDRRNNIGLHHLALSVPEEKTLNRLADKLRGMTDVEIEFMPEFMGRGPRKHMIFREPGGLRLEMVWSGE
ncbi:VOC family protein [Yoonia litorea]|uniref:Glyoxalase/Bleomycin resistance protein/Dioxygenase superfamily protein n=1 Tax=Yoonia litorea TaxID=1123755 RepID=A0A1I6MWY3_9RHOB|nr:VOC family protein [Yoonia litorea]SFS20210.1 Glyoxalase/Bleomycin resistance protein/Dioxygenase superfamily protein [Yoonia litorea]